MIQAGVDEVGRGCWAGDVFAAAVVYPEHLEYQARDSKKLNAKSREEAYHYLVENTIYCVGRSSVKEIDEINILNATLLAMKRAVEGLNICLDKVLIDGIHAPVLDYETETIIKGDDKIAQISAASIIAKVERDSYMLKCHDKYDMYGFKNHKGYGTKEHREKLHQYGLCNLHRLSFAPMKNLCSSI